MDVSNSTPQIPLFGNLRDHVAVSPIQDGLVFEWSRNAIGFGQLTLTCKDGKLIVDNECMSPEFCADVVKQAIEESLSS